MKIAWLVFAAVLLTACGRSESPAKAGDPSFSAAGDTAPPSARAPAVAPVVDLRSGRSPADYVQALEAFMRDNPNLQVIVGKGWDPAVFGTRAPHKAQLDQVSDFVPIVLISRDRHSIWTNSEGLAAAGINSDTPDPEGGVIERDENGLPTGLLRGKSAVALLEKIIPRSAGSQLEPDDPRHDQPDTK